MGSKKEEATKFLNLAGEGLELGPLTAPLVDKKESSVFYADHLSQEDLKKKYAKEPINIKDIVDVDYVLKGSLQETVKGKIFDYVIASHVIEHIPDTVRWLQDVAAVLKPGGILSLVIPDKRYTFDITRSLSTPTDVIGAYIEKRTRFTAESVLDFASEYRENIDPGVVLSQPLKDFSKSKRRWSDKEAYQMGVDNLQKYVDTHYYVYTPDSFLRILRALIEFGLLDYEVVYFQETQPNSIEFYISLRKSNVSKNKKLATIPTLPPPRKYVELLEDIENLSRKVDSLEHELHILTHSKSWQLTKPLRSALKLFNR